ncbi:hypothetical protein NM208_g2610 [Fusarium decemcellulare]|uniref:Uncharacterized protein n=1 Tax=Fusarium decemcellulare TaxID=57161 RepID=A0ACC1SS82_9HYPO|nr:hypothetical protein NM208_g2610 [Fusarium decemcellulare]
MVKVAIAGLGQLAEEVIGAILADGRHEVTILSRREASPADVARGLNWIQVEYNNKQKLAESLEGIHTVLSFILVHNDPGNHSQKNLIDACVQAGVKRFAPSEWAFFDVEHYPIYRGKLEIREYLKNINSKEKLLEYSLFLPGMFMNYLEPAEKMNKHLTHSDTFIDFKNRRAILPEGSNASLSLTRVEDVARVVAEALSSESEWPTHGGISGNKVTFDDILSIGQLVRGEPFAVSRVKVEDLKAGKLSSPWLPMLRHPSFSPEEVRAASEQFAIQSLLAAAQGGWEMSNEWNESLPGFEFANLKAVLLESWAGEP